MPMRCYGRHGVVLLLNVSNIAVSKLNLCAVVPGELATISNFGYVSIVRKGSRIHQVLPWFR